MSSSTPTPLAAGAVGAAVGAAVLGAALWLRSSAPAPSGAKAGEAEGRGRGSDSNSDATSVAQVIEADLTWTGQRFEHGVRVVVDARCVPLALLARVGRWRGRLDCRSKARGTAH